MIDLPTHPVVIKVLRPVAQQLIQELGDDLTEGALESLARKATKLGMQGEILFGGNKAAFVSIIKQGIHEASQIKDPEEREQVIGFLKVGCLREFVLEEARRIKTEEALTSISL